jgi:hypothetical protein
MATIDILLERQVLCRIVVPTGRERRLRWVYGFPEFQSWLANDQAPDPPEEQVDNILYRWITGKELRYSRQFRDLMPRPDEVWEMKTADVRIFGWMYQPLRFIAVFGDYADLYKGKNAPRSYDDAKQKVIKERNNLDLDEPKFATGTFDELVSI